MNVRSRLARMEQKGRAACGPCPTCGLPLPCKGAHDGHGHWLPLEITEPGVWAPPGAAEVPADAQDQDPRSDYCATCGQQLIYRITMPRALLAVAG